MATLITFGIATGLAMGVDRVLGPEPETHEIANLYLVEFNNDSNAALIHANSIAAANSYAIREFGRDRTDGMRTRIADEVDVAWVKGMGGRIHAAGVNVPKVRPLPLVGRLEHNHRHEHLDHLPEVVVKVEHEHWHVHSSTDDMSTKMGVYHSTFHVSFGQEAFPGGAVPAHKHIGGTGLDTVGLSDEEEDDEEEINEVDERDTNMDRAYRIARDGEDNPRYKADGERHMSEHEKVCSACSTCEECRKGVPHTHITALPNTDTHGDLPRLQPLNEYEAVNASG